MRFDFIDGKFKLENKESNVLALDFALIKEIQLEKEGNKPKKPKKPLSANPSKISKKKFFIPPVMGNLLDKNKNNNNNNNFNINKIINNYQPVFHFEDKSEQIIEKFNEEILI